MPLSSGKVGGGKEKGAAQVGTQCSYCHAVDKHYSVVCPQRAADIRKGSEACLTRARTTGVKCQLCDMPGHDKTHHQKAVEDYAKQQKNNAPPKSGSQGDRKPGKQPPSKWQPGGGTGKAGNPGNASDRKVLCPYGAKCRKVLNGETCDKWHEKEDLKQMRREYAAKKATDKATAQRKSGGKGGKGKSKSDNDKKDPGGKGKAGKGGKNGPSLGVPPNVKCFNCGGNHYRRDCPQAPNEGRDSRGPKPPEVALSLIHISEPTRLGMI